VSSHALPSLGLPARSCPSDRCNLLALFTLPSPSAWPPWRPGCCPPGPRSRRKRRRSPRGRGGASGRAELRSYWVDSPCPPLRYSGFPVLQAYPDGGDLLQGGSRQWLEQLRDHGRIGKLTMLGLQRTHDGSDFRPLGAYGKRQRSPSRHASAKNERNLVRLCLWALAGMQPRSGKSLPERVISPGPCSAEQRHEAR